ncbi:MAG TPA: hypothetical protein PLR25_01505 [Planctomycetaceae bacterium]|nr:hypothetical protein [Planctomycetaceae bacterium]
MPLDLKVRQASSLSLSGIRQAGSLSYLSDSPKSSAIGLEPPGHCVPEWEPWNKGDGAWGEH